MQAYLFENEFFSCFFVLKFKLIKYSIMKHLKIGFKVLCFIVFQTIFLTNVFSQDGFSSASLSVNRSNGITPSEQVIVEEFLNYHTHKIAMPKANEAVAIDLRWGNNLVGKNNEFAMLQVGVATGFVDDFSHIPPLNLCLVIDKSGSMSHDQRMVKLKVALSKFIEYLRPQDNICIVAYNSEAALVLPFEKIGEGNNANQVITSLMPDGSTNLNAGMMLGYEELYKNYDKNSTNRLILLTDGLTNTGETNIENIIKNSLEYNKKGIDISTIGVGQSLNFDLLRQLAKAGRGLNHFIGNSEDIEKIFIDEAESLLSPIANDVSLEIISDSGIKMQEVYGYSPIISKNKLSFKLDNMNSGLTQVFIIKYDVSNMPQNKSAEVNIVFKYYDIKLKEDKTIKRAIKITASKEQNINPLIDSEVKKNYTIAYISTSIKQMALAYESKNNNAKQILDNCINMVEKYYPNLEDKDIIRVLDIAKENVVLLNKIAVW